MKNKKSKIVVPALALILLSTAASISGSVAWFTAARTATVKAGEFAVIRTGDDLDVEFAAVAGVQVHVPNTSDGIPEDTIQVKGNYNLTDASFDHTKVDGTGPYVVKPNVPRTDVLGTTGIDDTLIDNFETALSRGTNVYSAAIWTMTFSIEFSDSATDDVGLFLDLSSADTYMHEKVVIKNNGTIPAGLYTDPKCTSAQTTAGTNETGEDAIYYRSVPEGTGKAFRIAFIPTAIGGTGTGYSKGYAKVWADNEGTTTGEGKYIDNSVEYNSSSEGTALTQKATAYGAKTISFTNEAGGGNKYTSVTSGLAGSYMGAADTGLTVPADNSRTNSTALSTDKNYLGFFKKDAGKTVTMTYTCVAWYDGTSPFVDNNDHLDVMAVSMKFGVSNLN